MHLWCRHPVQVGDAGAAAVEVKEDDSAARVRTCQQPEGRQEVNRDIVIERDSAATC